MSILGRITVALALAGLLAACGDSGSSGDGGVHDAAGDGVTPPPLEGGVDTLTGKIGRPCDVSDGSGCPKGTMCLDVGLGVGVCVIPACTPEDVDTPTREDDCPAGSACARVPVRDAQGTSEVKPFCVPSCVPEATRNACAEINQALSCDPASVLFTGHTEVCLFPACKKAGDCGNRNELDPDARCDTTTGVCFTLGKPGGQVGAPCKIGADCGPDQFCLAERQVGGDTKVSGGYCTVVGCKYAPKNDPQGPWHCPAGSTCYGLGTTASVSLCLASGGCTPTNPPESDGCRDEAPKDQYKCIDVDGTGVCWLQIN